MLDRRVRRFCLKVKGDWKYLYRADKEGKTVDFLLTARRCLLPTSFMHWQDKSVPFEELASVPAPNTFINRQRDRTVLLRAEQ